MRFTLGLLVACAVLFPGGRAEAVPLFAAADTSALVVRAKVEGSTPYPKAKLLVFHLRVTRVLKGAAAEGERVELAQEMLFANTKPLLVDGTETLVFAVPLPSYSSFQEALPKGTYWRWVERLETAADVAPLGDPALTNAVAGYLATAGDAEALADFLVRTIVDPHARIRQDALQDVRMRREIPPLLDAGRLQPVADWLGDASQSPVDRANVIVQLARARAAGMVSIAERLAAETGPLQAPAIDALITLGAPPPVERLLALSKSTDEAMRLVAARGLATASTPEALARLAELLANEPSTTIRVTVMQALGRTPDARVVALASGELAKNQKDVTVAAAEALVRQGTPEAVEQLRKALEEGQESSRMAAAFALKKMNRRETDEILEQVEATHPDPAVRRLCKLALGESMHEH